MSARPVVILLCIVLVSPVAAAANWQPDAGDWTTFRRDRAHTATTDAAGAFTTNVADLRVKWQRSDDPGYWVPPVAADLDGDGVAEVVGVVGNASADQNNAQNPVNLESGLNVVNGATGALKWSLAPEAGYLDFFSPVLGDIDADGKGEIVFLHMAPLTGSSLTNKILAYTASGQKKWEWSDTNWGSKTPLGLNALNLGDVDGESDKQEVVALVLLATVTTTISGGKVQIAGSNPEYRVVALSGEGSSAQKTWEKSFPGKASASSPALGDLNEDGTLDVVWGGGVKPGTIIETSAARITVSNDFADDRIFAVAGGAAPGDIFTRQVAGFYPGDLGLAPAIADLEQDGDLDIVQPLWVRNFPPSTAEQTTVLAMNKDGTTKWTSTVNAAVAANIAQVPPAIADLDGDGKLDIVLQTDNGSPTDRYRAIALRHDGSLLWRSADFGRTLTSAPAVGDITGDGKAEVLVVTSSSSTVAANLVVLNGQTGTELFRRALDVGVLSVGGPILADLDGDDDGRLEILVNTGNWGAPGKLYAFEPELPDLRLTGLAFGATEHLHGVPEQVSATVTNIGSRQATGALVRFTDGADTLHEATLTLAPGASQTVQFQWTPANVGTRTIKASADPAKGIAEWAENNNEQSATVQVRAPDFRFAAADPVFSDPTPGVGDTITVGGTITNVGGKDAANVLVRFVDGANVFHETTLASLAKGASQAVSADLLVEGEFDRVVGIRADPLGAIVEESEANNVAERLLDVIFIAPDLAPGAIGFSNPTPGAEETITVSVDVTNAGSKDAGELLVRFLDDGAVFGEEVVPSLAEGASRTVRKDLFVVGEYVHTITVQVDPANAVLEEREDNNVATRALSVLAPDLAVLASDIALSDRNPDEGDALTVTAAVRNVGTGGRVPQNVLVTLVDGGVAVASDTIPSIPAGQSGIAELTYAIGGLGPRTLTVRVDPLGAINELSELNNEATAALVVGKVRVALAMTKGVYGYQEQASGLATLTFRNSGTPLANREFTIPIEYVMRTSSGAPAAQEAANAVAAVVAQAGGSSVQGLHVCVLGRCADATIDTAGAVAQMLGSGSGAGGQGPELRFRLFTIDAKTNSLGQAGFVVPHSLLTTLDALEGALGAEVCFTGLGHPLGPVGGPAPPACAASAASVPALPGAANLPGRYRASGIVDWYGFGFAGSTDYHHV